MASKHTEPPKKPIRNSRADRIIHHIAEIHREIKAAYDDGLDVIECADLGAMIEPFKDEINRRREEDDRPDRKLGTEVVTIEGISYRVHRTEEGSTIETPCACLGSHTRTHDNIYCPWMAQRTEAVERGRA